MVCSFHYNGSHGKWEMLANNFGTRCIHHQLYWEIKTVYLNFHWIGIFTLFCFGSWVHCCWEGSLQYLFCLIYSLSYFLHYILLPLYPLPFSNHHTVVHQPESFLPFAHSLHPLSSPSLTSYHLLSICESVSVFLIILMCSMDST